MFLIYYNIIYLLTIPYKYLGGIFHRNILKNYLTKISILYICLYFRYLVIRAKKINQQVKALRGSIVLWKVNWQRNVKNSSH